jgi:hypothetical protein
MRPRRRRAARAPTGDECVGGCTDRNELQFMRQETHRPWRGSTSKTPLDTQSETSRYETSS